MLSFKFSYKAILPLIIASPNKHPPGVFKKFLISFKILSEVARLIFSCVVFTFS